MHRSFLLRCWREQDRPVDGHWHWHFSVREVEEKAQEHHLHSPGELVDFLLAHLTNWSGEG